MLLEDECFIRSTRTEMTPEKVFEMTYGLTGDKDKAEKSKEWAWLRDF